MRETGDEGHPFLLTHYDIDSMINLIFKIYFYVRIFYL